LVRASSTKLLGFTLGAFVSPSPPPEIPSHLSCFISLTHGPWFQILDIVIYFVNQFVPIYDIPAAFLKVMRFDNLFQKDWIEMKGVIGSPEW